MKIIFYLFPFLKLATVVGSLAVILVKLRLDYWFVDIIISFLFPSIFPSLCCLVVSVLAKSRTWMFVSFAHLSLSSTILYDYINLSSFFQDFSRIEARDENQLHFSILSANVHVRNTNYTMFAENVKKINPTVVVVIEANDAWHSSLMKSFAETYPFVIAEPRKNAFGMSVYSKIPIVYKMQLFSDKGFPLTLEFHVQLANKKDETDSSILRIISAHTFPPLSQNAWTIRNMQLSELANYLNLSNQDVVVVGDFNSLPWSSSLVSFKTKARLIDARERHCLCNTWLELPSFGCIDYFGIPIDYIFYRGNIRLIRLKTEFISGSDHNALYAEFFGDTSK